MNDTYSLLIFPAHAELVSGDVGAGLGPDLRLVHEQRHEVGGMRWYFYAERTLSKPEALRRAQQWYDSSAHPDWPGLAGRS